MRSLTQREVLLCHCSWGCSESQRRFELALELDNRSGISFWFSPQFPIRREQWQKPIENKLLDNSRFSADG